MIAVSPKPPYLPNTSHELSNSTSFFGPDDGVGGFRPIAAS